MNVSLKWLGTLVDIKGFKPEDMAEVLTCDGIPVEHVIHPAPGIKGVVTGKILKVEKKASGCSASFGMPAGRGAG
ncbi:hypothetical protein [Allisonella histaminiformans]|uniref:hypothetical protein n=1 Tax=Allisonella histaminiformans TaxID=209880 RepID=UPI003522DF45